MSVKRSFLVYVLNLATLGVILYRLYFSSAEKSTLISLVLVTSFLLCMAVLAWLIINYNYIELIDGKVVICSEFFLKESFDANEAASVTIGDSPFSKSYFVLKNSSTYEFNYFFVNENDFRKLIDYLKIEMK